MKNNKSFLSLYLILAFLCFQVQLKAQIFLPFGASRSGTTGYQFLKIYPDARSSSLAGNMISLVDDPSALYWNPAGITQSDSTGLNIQLGKTAYVAGTDLNYLALCTHKNQNYFGISVINFRSGEMPLTTEFQPLGTGQYFNATSNSIGLTFARILTENFSFGITGKWINENIANIVLNNVLVDFGFQYNTGFENTSFAVSVSNFGFNQNPQGIFNTFNLEGISFKDRFEAVAVPAIFRIGFSWDPIILDQHLLKLSTQLNHPTDNRETFGLGAEYLFHNLLFIRSGFEFAGGNQSLPAFGFGIKTQRNFGIFKLDYGFNDKYRLGATHRVTLGISIL